MFVIFLDLIEKAVNESNEIIRLEKEEAMKECRAKIAKLNQESLVVAQLAKKPKIEIPPKAKTPNNKGTPSVRTFFPSGSTSNSAGPSTSNASQTSNNSTSKLTLDDLDDEDFFQDENVLKQIAAVEEALKAGVDSPLILKNRTDNVSPSVSETVVCMKNECCNKEADSSNILPTQEAETLLINPSAIKKEKQN